MKKTIFEGTVSAVCTSEKTGTVKVSKDEIVLEAGSGVSGDAHAGSWHRQVSLISKEHIENFEKESGETLVPGAFGENIIVSGFDPASLSPGSILKIGDAELEITQLGKECHSDCVIKTRTGKCIMPVYGVFAEVKKSGVIRPGDGIEVFAPDLARPFQCAIITVSDKGSSGQRKDESGPMMEKLLTDAGYEIRESIIIPDEKEIIKRNLKRLSDKRGMDIIFTSGGTGFAKRDVTPEATEEVIEKRVPGIPEALRANSMKYTDRAMLSRQTAGIRGNTLIVNLPGSPKAVKENLEYLIPLLRHGLEILRGTDGECGADHKK